MRAELWSNTLFETLNEAIMILDANFCVVALNPVAEQLLGVSSQFAVGHADRFFTGLSVPEPQAQEARERLMRGGLVKERVWFQRSNGTQFRAEFLAKAVLRSSILEHQEITRDIISSQLEGVFVNFRDVTEDEARDSRQALLARTLQALTQADSLEQTQFEALEALTAEFGADGAVVRLRQADGFQLVASRGSYVPPETVQILPEIQAAWARGETTQTYLPQDIRSPLTQKLFDLGFVYSVGVGQLSAGRLVGSLTLMYQRLPTVDLRPVCHKLLPPWAHNSSVGVNGSHLRHWQEQTVPCVKPATKSNFINRWWILLCKPRTAPPPVLSCTIQNKKRSRWLRRLARTPINLLG